VDLKIWVKKHSQSSIFENKNLKKQIIIKPGMFGFFFFCLANAYMAIPWSLCYKKILIMGILHFYSML